MFGSEIPPLQAQLRHCTHSITPLFLILHMRPVMRITLGHLFNMQIPGLQANLRGGGTNLEICMFKKHLG